ncbi:MAG: acyl carrier protein [Deltaproteobacteria bacterium]|nr:MAG: acyl carrier protein [Deltaproteobacteria bacterium]
MKARAIKDRILQLARDELGIAPDDLEALASQDLAHQLDSVQRLTLVVAIEDTFEVCLDPDDERVLATLDDVVALIVAKAAEPA